MKFKIPFTFSRLEVLKKRSKPFLKLVIPRKKSRLSENLKAIEVGVSREEYLSICIRLFFMFFPVFLIISLVTLFLFKIKLFYLYGLVAGLAISGFIFLSQVNYPRIYCAKKDRDIERNLLSAMQDMLVQLHSGVPIFNILTNIAGSSYGELSIELGKAVNKINAGNPQIEVLDELGNKTTSPYFRRVLWQLSNGMRAGSDMSVVIQEGISNLSKEQVIQIQSYGSKLNPLVVFYMLVAIILPSLGITFLTIISSMLGLAGNMVKLMFVAVFTFVILIQIMFLGLIKNRRPSLI